MDGLMVLTQAGRAGVLPIPTLLIAIPTLLIAIATLFRYGWESIGMHNVITRLVQRDWRHCGLLAEHPIELRGHGGLEVLKTQGIETGILVRHGQRLLLGRVVGNSQGYGMLLV
jgi:hypothetical protein